MKRYLKIGLLVLLAGGLGGAVFQMRQTLTAQTALSAQLRHRPNLSAVRFVRKPLPAMLHNKLTLIVLFDPDCEHCQYQAQQMRLRQADFAGAGLYWLTTQPLARAQAFARAYGLDSLNMMHVGTLTREEAYRAFGAAGVPHIFIYGANGQLQREYKGEVKVDALTKYLH
ncbi:peroxiredoxin family protein [Spirosoma montaniterrae]|uniref:Thioredoxin domain-containing protein n=1 Tax=Spirosoma montaniterrae TaxID=1178516 RepID=A0A1P9WRV7_9BACT|nr:hypothetical protein [Spirosoma montaniterrae]AQG78099.1 hypothetical protein AWR27_01270 [Spirosoma montaniterrae]